MGWGIVKMIELHVHLLSTSVHLDPYSAAVLYLLQIALPGEFIVCHQNELLNPCPQGIDPSICIK